MPSTLYLDAARMGQMAPSAQWALQDFVRVAGEEGCTLYFERFFRDGFSAWPRSLQSRFPGLRSWGGIAELKSALTGFAGLSPDSRPLLAGQSTKLMNLAARLLFQLAGGLLEERFRAVEGDAEMIKVVEAWQKGEMKTPAAVQALLRILFPV